MANHGRHTMHPRDTSQEDCQPGRVCCKSEEIGFGINIFSLPSWSNKSICWLCKANCDDKPYWDFSPNAAWRSSRYKRGEFGRVFREQGLSPSGIFSLPGMSLDFVCIDVLHALDLGVSQEAIGNCLWEFLSCGILAGNQGHKLNQLWERLKVHYKTLQTPSQLQNLTLEMLRRPNKGPKLAAKGAETRGMVPFAFECAREMHSHCQTTHSLTVVHSLSNFLEFYTLLALNTWHAEVAAKACRRFCILYQALNEEANRAGNPWLGESSLNCTCLQNWQNTRPPGWATHPRTGIMGTRTSWGGWPSW